MKKLINYLFLIFLFLLNGCGNRPLRSTLPQEDNRPVTIFIHGTLYPFLDLLVRAFDCRVGLTPALEQGPTFIHGRIPFILNEADPMTFPIESAYVYGWSGRLTFEARRRAAQCLYRHLKKFNGPITIIAHSHGATLVQLLTEEVARHNDTDLKIKKFVMLGCPVLSGTEEYVCSPLFEQVISLYSLGDSTQIMDPQFLSQENRRLTHLKGRWTPLFSTRYSPCAPNVIHRRILLGNRNMTHMDFIYKPFLTRLPAILRLIEESINNGQVNTHNEHYIINVPRDRTLPPELLIKTRKDGQHISHPRGNCCAVNCAVNNRPALMTQPIDESTTNYSTTAPAAS